MKLEDVKWAYGARAEGFRATGTPGVLVSTEAVPEGKAVPPRLEEYGRTILEEILAEDVEGGVVAPTGEALCFSGNVRWWKGEEWWEFSTLSSYSLTLWVGKLDGYLTTTEMLEDGRGGECCEACETRDPKTGAMLYCGNCRPSSAEPTDDPLRRESYGA